MIPYGRQSVDDNDIQAVVDVLTSDWLTTGPVVDRFESELARAVGADGTVAVSNGTAALHAAVLASGIGPGDEVIVPGLTFCATANAVLYAGARPVFADVSPETLLIDVAHAASLVNERTRAIIAVDYAGQPADYRALREICDRHRMVLIADGCHSLGGARDGVPSGVLADMTCFSFHPVKPITSGEGGAIAVCHRQQNISDQWLKTLRAIRNHGIESDHRSRQASGRHQYDMAHLGFNYRLSDIHAALALSQLARLPEFRSRREAIARTYDCRLPTHEPFRPLALESNVTHARHLYVVRTESQIRDDVFQHLRSQGIMANVHYRPVYEHSYYRQLGIQADCPNTDQVSREVISLPIFPDLTDGQIESVVDAITAYFGRKRLAA